MVATLNYGKDAWALKLGTVVPGTDTEAGATFDNAACAYICLLCKPEDLNIKFTDGQKVVSAAGGYNYKVPTGKRQWSVSGTAVVVQGDEGGSTADVVGNINTVNTWIAARQEAADTSVYYLIVRIHAKSVKFYQQTSAHYYMGAHCEVLEWAGIWYGHARLRFRFVEAW